MQAQPNLNERIKERPVNREHQRLEKGVPAEPHPIDRRSGTGRGKEDKKKGGGQSNWGNLNDDLKADKYTYL